MKTATALLFCFGLAAQAQTPQTAPKTPVGTAVEAPSIDFYDSMADYFRLTPNAISLINKKGIPDAEIPALLYIVRHSSASPNELIAAKTGGGSWGDIAKRHKVSLPGNDFVSDANVVFLSEFHGRPASEVKAMRAKGASFLEINQEYRRSGTPVTKKKTGK